MPADPLTTPLGREDLWLRELLEAVGKDLEGISTREEYVEHAETLLSRSMQIREVRWKRLGGQA